MMREVVAKKIAGICARYSPIAFRYLILIRFNNVKRNPYHLFAFFFFNPLWTGGHLCLNFSFFITSKIIKLSFSDS